MLHNRFMKCAAILMLCLMAPQIGIVDIAYGAMVKIPVGTRVLLRVEEDLTPQTKGVGDKVPLSVMNDVIIEGKTVIAAGAPGIGEITISSKQGVVGAAAEIAFKTLYVTAVDGQNLLIDGSLQVKGKSKMAESIIVTILCCILALLATGQKAEIKKGTTLTAMALSPSTIEVK